MTKVKGLCVVVAIVAVAVVATSAGAASLTGIGVLTPTAGGTTISWVSAISPDGTYAVGYSNGTNIAGTSTINQPVVWSQATGLVQLPNATDASFMVRGVAVRSNNNQIALAGAPSSGPTMYTYEAPLSNLAGGSWSQTSLGTNATLPGAASLQYNVCRLDSTSGTADSWYVAGANKPSSSTTTNGLRYGMDGATTAEYQSARFAAGYYVNAYAVSGNGYMAGSDRGYGKNIPRAIRLDTPGAGTVDPPTTSQTVIPGGVHAKSEALGISKNGLSLCGYDNGTDGLAKAFAWTVGQSGMVLLGQVAGDNASQAFVMNDAGTVGGYSTDGTNMKAVIWDSTGTWDTTGAAKTVWSLLDAAGVDLSDWTSLTRLTTMSDDGRTIAGTGKWIDGTTRGWIATIPEPATLSFLALGGLALLRRRRR